MSPPQYSDNSHYITQFYTLKVKAGASPSVLAESDALASFFYFFSFNQDRTGRIFAVVDAVEMCVNGQYKAELWETMFAGCGKDDSFSIGP